MKTPFYEDEDITMSFNEDAGRVLLHCDVRNWKLSVYKKLLREGIRFQNLLLEKGVNEMFTITPNPKFAEILGGRFIGSTLYEGNQYEVYVWELNQQ